MGDLSEEGEAVRPASVWEKSFKAKGTMCGKDLGQEQPQQTQETPGGNWVRIIKGRDKSHSERS